MTAGCGGGGGDKANTTLPVTDPLAPATTRGRYRDLQYALTLPRTQFSVGDDMLWTLTVTNVGDKPVTIEASHSAFDMYHIYKGAEIVRLAPRDDTDALGTETFAPGQTRTYSQRWQDAPYLAPKAPGKFTLTSWVVANQYNGETVTPSDRSFYQQPSPLSPAPIEFTIK